MNVIYMKIRIKAVIAVFLVILSLGLFFSCQDHKNVIIQGNLREGSGNSIRLEYLDVNKTIPLDSVEIRKNGDFRFRTEIKQPGLYILKNNGGKIINLLISPGEFISIEGNYPDMDRNYTVKGSPDSEHIRQLVEKLNDTREQLRKLDAGYEQITEFTVEQANEYLLKRNQIIREQRDFTISFIIENLSSMASIYALYQKITPDELVLNENRDIQYMKIVADSLALKYPGSDFVMTFVGDARLSEKRYKNLIGLQKKIYEAQYGLPDIELPDMQGNNKSLSSLHGKTVLLYVWSVYSDFCRQQNPSLEKIYKKYRNRGFEIYAVCIDKNPEHWMKMVRFDELSFINTHGPGFQDTETAGSYNLRSVPSNYLLDKNGNILARDLYGPELEKWLDNKL